MDELFCLDAYNTWSTLYDGPKVSCCSYVIIVRTLIQLLDLVSRGQTLDGKVRVWSTAHIGLVLTPTPTGVGDKYMRTTALMVCRAYYKALSKQTRAGLFT